MDPQLHSLIGLQREGFTEELIDWKEKDLKDIAEDLDNSFSYIFRSLREKGIFYSGITRVCPLEFYTEITRSSSATKEFENAKNSFFGVRVNFEPWVDPKTGIKYDLKCPLMFLPYTNEYDDIYIRNSLYNAQFVLAERGPCVDGENEKTIFVSVLGYKFKVTKEMHTFKRINIYGKNVVDSSITMKLPATRFYNSRNSRKVTSKRTPLPLMTWYVFGKYGFTESMRRYGECDFVINDLETVLKECPPSEGWEIYSNNDFVHPKAFNRDISTMIDPVIAIRPIKGDNISNLGMQIAGSFLFMMGVFANMYDLSRLDDPDYWRLLIGKCSINLPAKTSDETYMRQMVEHFSSVEEYADARTLTRYRNNSIDVNDTYELFNWIVINYSHLIRTYNPANMLHKELACKEFLLENIIHSANDFRYKLKNKSNISQNVINREIDTHFRLFGIDKSLRENNVSLEQTGTDNPFIDYQLSVIHQTKNTVTRNPGQKKDEFNPNHPANRIDASQPFVVSYQCATGPHPDGRGMLIPRLFLVGGRYVGIRPEDIPTYQKVKRELS